MGQHVRNDDRAGEPGRTGVNQSFITGASTPCGVAVDANYVYWANVSTGTIGRANLDGTGVNQSFITGANHPCGVAVDGSHVYWANEGACSSTCNGTTIGRANLDGSSPSESFITGLSAPVGVAVNSSFIYWGNNNSNTIGRANLDGTGPNTSFITGSGGCTDFPALDATYIYWSNACDSSIGRANLDGSGVNESFITTLSNPGGVAVDLPRLTANQPACTIKAVSNRVLLPAAKKTGHHKKPKGKPGTLQFVATCNQGASLTLTGTVTEIIKGKHHNKHGKTLSLPKTTRSVQAHVPLTLTVKLPAAALKALAAARESVAVTLTAANANGSGTVTTKIARLQTRRS